MYKYFKVGHLTTKCEDRSKPRWKRCEEDHIAKNCSGTALPFVQRKEPSIKLAPSLALCTNRLIKSLPNVVFRVSVQNFFLHNPPVWFQMTKKLDAWFETLFPVVKNRADFSFNFHTFSVFQWLFLTFEMKIVTVFL